MNAHGLDVAVDNGDSPAAAPSNNTAYTTFRDAFNTQAFLVHPDTGALSLRPDKGKTSTALTTEKWQELVDTLRSWGPKDESGEYIPLNAIEDIEQRDAVSSFRRENKSGHHLAKNFTVETYIKEDEVFTKHTWRLATEVWTTLMLN